MIHIISLEALPDSFLLLRFDDGTEKLVDMKPFIGDDALTNPLQDAAYFRQVRLYANGRGVFWPNEYDMCPDYLRYHAPDARPAVVG